MLSANFFAAQLLIAALEPLLCSALLASLTVVEFHPALYHDDEPPHPAINSAVHPAIIHFMRPPSEVLLCRPRTRSHVAVPN